MRKFRLSIATKSTIGIILLLIVFFVFVAFVGYNGFTDAMMNEYSDGAFRTAETAVGFISGVDIDQFSVSEGKTPQYLDVYGRLDRLCQASDSTFIYIIQPDTTDYAHIKFLFSTINRNSSYTVYDFGYVRETTNDEYREKYRRLYEGKSEQALVVRDQGFIETDPHITAMVPVKDEAGKTHAILCVQWQMDELLSSRNAYVNRVMMSLFTMIVVVILGQTIFQQRMLIRPIRKISDETVRFAAENVPAEKKLEQIIHAQDEIGQLAVSVDRMEEQVQQYVQDMTRISAEKERAKTEMGLANRIQAAMLPHTFPPFPDRSEFDIYASMDPAREVGGDFYDFFLIDDDHLCLAIADVSGKGVPAALFMMSCKFIVQNKAMTGFSPGEILTEANQAICSHNQEEMFVTVWLGILEISTGKLTACNAGHEYPVLKKPDGKYELLKDKHGLAVGALEGIRYREYELTLEKGSRLFVYTDGVPEATDAENNMFGTDRMLEALNAEAEAPPKESLQNVRKAVDDFVKDAEQFDDLTMLGLEYRG